MDSFWHGKRVLVTGHTGFKGGWLSLWLARLGAEVYGYAQPPKGPPSFCELIGVEDFVVSSIGDVRSYDNFQKVLLDADPHIIFHLAAQPLVRKSYDDPRETFETNVMGTLNLMEAIRVNRSSCKTVVNVTTDKCYQNNHWLWGYREIDPLGGSEPYSYSKSCAEFVASAYRKSFFESLDIQLVSVRAGNVIGGGDWSQDRLIPDIMNSIFAGNPLRIRNPESIRPWQHVLEPLFGYMTIAKLLYLNELELGDDSHAFNFGPKLDAGMSVESIARIMVDHHGGGAFYEIIRHEGEARKEEKMLLLDSTKAKSLLNWGAKLDLGQALIWTYDWYENFYGGKPMKEFSLGQIEKYEQLLA